MDKRLSRRDFLKLCGIAFAGLADGFSYFPLVLHGQKEKRMLMRKELPSTNIYLLIENLALMRSRCLQKCMKIS